MKQKLRLSGHAMIRWLERFPRRDIYHYMENLERPSGAELKALRRNAKKGGNDCCSFWVFLDAVFVVSRKNPGVVVTIFQRNGRIVASKSVLNSSGRYHPQSGKKRAPYSRRKCVKLSDVDRRSR